MRNVKNLRIIRILLENKGLTKYRIAKLSDCSVPWVIEFLRKLEKAKVSKPDELIDYAISRLPKLKYSEYYAKDPIKLLKESKLNYALTTYGAENLTTHQLFPSRYDIYIKEEDKELWKKDILNDGLIGKGNVRLIIPKDESVFKESRLIKNINLVSKPQLLIDLKKEGGVCTEAYNLIIKNV